MPKVKEFVRNDKQEEEIHTNDNLSIFVIIFSKDLSLSVPLIVRDDSPNFYRLILLLPLKSKKILNTENNIQNTNGSLNI